MANMTFNDVQKRRAKLNRLYAERDKILQGKRLNPSGTVSGIRRLQKIEQQIYDLQYGVRRFVIAGSVQGKKG